MNFIKLYIYLGLEINRIDFNALSKNSKSFLCLFLKNVFYLKNTPLKLTYNKIKSIFKKNGKKRRNEEKIKLIYKSALKKF